MSGIDPVEAVEIVTRAIYLATARVPPTEAVIEADVAYGSMHVAVPPLNAVFAARFTEANADARIDDVLAWYAARSMPPFWWVGPADTPVDLPERLLAKGLMEDETVPGMAADLTAFRDESRRRSARYSRGSGRWATTMTCRSTRSWRGLTTAPWGHPSA